MQARRDQNETFREVRRNINQPRMMYLAKLSFKSEGEIDFVKQAKIGVIC